MVNDSSVVIIIINVELILDNRQSIPIYLIICKHVHTKPVFVGLVSIKIS